MRMNISKSFEKVRQKYQSHLRKSDKIKNNCAFESPFEDEKMGENLSNSFEKVRQNRGFCPVVRLCKKYLRKSDIRTIYRKMSDLSDLGKQDGVQHPAYKAAGVSDVRLS